MLSSLYSQPAPFYESPPSNQSSSKYTIETMGHAQTYCDNPGCFFQAAVRLGSILILNEHTPGQGLSLLLVSTRPSSKTDPMLHDISWSMRRQFDQESALQ